MTTIATISVLAILLLTRCEFVTPTNLVASSSHQWVADSSGAENDNGRRCLGACQCYDEKYAVNCTGKAYDTVPYDIPSETKLLDLSVNEISRIKSADFSGLKNVELLDLNHNSISTIAQQPFQDMRSLKQLKFGYNNIGALREDMFSGLEKLEDLDLQYSSIQTFPPDSFSRLGYLKTLNINFNVIFSLANGTFSGLVNLTTLNMDGSYLYDIPMLALEAVKKGLKKFSMSYSTRLTAIGGSSSPIIDLPNLETLTLSSCRIQSIIGGSLSGLPKLRDLDLTFNNLIVLFPRTFVGILGLNSLRLARNPLQAFPYNALQPISKTLSYLEMSYFGFSELGILPSVYNQSYLSNLTTLILEDGLLESIEGDSVFKNLKSLENLRIAGTYIKQLPSKAMKHLDSLCVAQFVGNPISKIEKEDISALAALKEFELSNSDLVSLDDGTFEGLGLKKLRLNDNKITNISSKALSFLSNLTVVDLSNNLLKVPNDQWFVGKPLQEVRLEGNPWNCDCLAVEYQLWAASLEYQTIQDIDPVLCDQPREVKGSYVNSLSPDQLTCDFADCPSTCVCVAATKSRITSERHSKTEYLKTYLVQEYSSVRNAMKTHSSSPLQVFGYSIQDWTMQRITNPDAVNADCTGSRLTHIPEMPNTTVYLNVASNEISALTVENFSPLENLKIFLASDNLIREIQNNTFMDASHLKEIYLNKNKLFGLIMPGWFANMTELLELRLDDNLLSEISSDSFSNLISLEILDLSRNSIKKLVPGAFTHLARLEYLNMASNQIQTIDEHAFWNLSSLAFLYLTDNHLTNIPAQMLLENQMLTYLDIGGNNLGIVQDGFLLSDTLEFLKMEDGYNPELKNGSFRGLTNLKVLRLGYSAIKKIEDHAFSLTVTEFHDSNNKSKMLTLDLGYNNLDEIPLKSLEDLRSLETLSLNNNVIKTLSSRDETDEVFLPSLQTLYLTNNDITEVPPESFISKLHGLLALVMSDCRMRQIPYEAMQNLTKLRHVIFDRNPILMVGNGLQLDALEQIQLSDTETLVSISEDAFAETPQLKRLALSGGRLRDIPSHAFDNLKNLEVLDLSRNMLQYPYAQWFSGMDPHTVKSIVLHQNPWVCDCNTVEYKQWLENGADGLDEYFVSMICDTPQMHKSWSLSEVNITDLVCDSTEEITTTAIYSNEFTTTAFSETPASTSSGSTTALSTVSPDCNQCSYDEISKGASCSGQRLRSVPKGCFPSDATSLDLSNNMIDELKDNDFEGLPELEAIDISSNRISSISSNAFRDLTSLLHLDLSSNSLPNVPTDALSLVSSSLLTLFLNDQAIPRLSENSFPLPYLQKLSLTTLAGNEIIPITIDDFTFAKLTSLLTLDLSKNTLLALGRNTFTGLEKLNKLDLTRTRLQEFPEAAMRRLSRLTDLTVNENTISYLGPAVTPILPNLRRFFLRYSSISSIADNSFLKHCVLLEELDLGYSSLESVPSTQNIFSLETLHLDFSRITEINQADFSSEKLSHVNLQGSTIKEVGEKAFSSVTNLARLDLDNNQISFIADNAFQDVAMTYLDLTNNSLSYVSCAWFDNMLPGHLDTVKLTGNKYHCSCGMLGYRDYMTTPEYALIKNVEEPVCFTPEKLSGEPLGEIKLEDLAMLCEGDLESPRPTYCGQFNTPPSVRPPDVTTPSRSDILNISFLPLVLAVTTYLLL